jgi:hypothetical protein
LVSSPFWQASYRSSPCILPAYRGGSPVGETDLLIHQRAAPSRPTIVGSTIRLIGDRHILDHSLFGCDLK